MAKQESGAAMASPKGNAQPNAQTQGQGDDGFVEQMQAAGAGAKPPESIPAGSIMDEDGIVEGIDDARALEIMKATPAHQLVELTAQYLKFTDEMKGDHFFRFTGMTTFTGDKGLIDAVNLVSLVDGTTFIAAQTVIVNSLRKVVELPAFVKITYKGMVKAASGSYADVKVFVFPHVAGR